MSLDDRELSTLIRTHATRHSAPDALRAGIRTQIALADANRARAASPPAETARARWSLFRRWHAIPVSFAMGMLCMALVLPVAERLNLGQPVDADLVASHVRALQVGPLTEVVSTDRHTVKPWFQGRLDYAPPVFDLSTEGFPLLGGRIEHVRGNVVATLAYARHRHVVDVFVWPASETSPPQRMMRKGFNVMHWADGSMQYWVVSDLERSEIETFTNLWRQRAAEQ
jgi:anti-sigma factor RsiW